MGCSWEPDAMPKNGEAKIPQRKEKMQFNNSDDCNIQDWEPIGPL
jgi:hypothetical protein